MDAGLLQGLQNPALYDHPVRHFEVLETHISWVLLTGPYAYKIKKPVALGFIDCTDPAQRRRFCHDEVRLNGRLAPALYLEVLAVVQERDGITLVADTDASASPPADAVEYLVRMRQFDQQGLLDHLQENGALKPDHVDSLAGQLADFHERTDRADDDHGSGPVIGRWAMENFDHALALASTADRRETLNALRCWTGQELERLAPRFEQRRDDGFVRDCHGDLHLGNVAVVDDKVTVFDCIEFNDSLRVIDVISEVAFLYMDLLSRDETALAWRFLDRYLARTGDYAGLDLLRFYAVYRAMVRTKVAMIRGTQPGLSKDAADAAGGEASAHLALASRLMSAHRPMLILTRGLSGSGKSRLAARLVETCGLVRLRSDVERKRLHGLAAGDSSGSGLDQGLYSAAAGRRTYRYLAGLAGSLLVAGLPVIVDAAFLHQWQREIFISLASANDVPLHILDLHADEVTLQKRLRRRQLKGGDPSEADIMVLENQIASADPLTTAEMRHTIAVDANDGQVDHALETLPDRLGCRAP